MYSIVEDYKRTVNQDRILMCPMHVIFLLTDEINLNADITAEYSMLGVTFKLHYFDY